MKSVGYVAKRSHVPNPPMDTPVTERCDGSAPVSWTIWSSNALSAVESHPNDGHWGIKTMQSGCNEPSKMYFANEPP